MWSGSVILSRDDSDVRVRRLSPKAIPIPHARRFENRAVARYVAFLAQNDFKIVAGALLLFVAAVVAASRLELRSDFTELLPQDDPELVKLREIADRVGTPSTLVVAIEGPDPTANERCADVLVQNLQSLIGTDLRAIDYRADLGRPFFEHNMVLYANLVDLRRSDDDLRKLVISRKNPAFIPFADSDYGEEEDDPAKDLRRLGESLSRHNDAATRFPNGYYESEDRAMLAIVTWTRSSGTGDVSGFRIRGDVQRVIEQTAPASFGNVRAQITGDVASAIEEHDALKSDIEWASLVCSVLVLTAISLYYRSISSLVFIFFPTLLGVAIAFGVTAVTIGYLNTNTAFLGSIILGNGINFGIIFLARYREERLSHPGRTVEDCLEQAVSLTAKPTLAAALAAAISYGSLALTKFRGFQQFGEVGGVGMLLCWMSTYCYCPSLIHLVERRRRRGLSGRASSSSSLTSMAGALLRQRYVSLGIAGAATVLALWPLVPFIKSPFEYDFSKLRNQVSRQHGVGALYARVGRIFPQDLAPIGIALLPRASDAPSYRRALLEKDCADALARASDQRAADPARLGAECARRVGAGEPTGGLLLTVSTAHDYLPRDQSEKMEVLAQIARRLRDPAMRLLTPEERQEIEKWAPPKDLRKLTPADLPEGIARPFREIDGTVGRVALIYPVRVWPNWDGHALMRISDVMREVSLPGGQTVYASGPPSLFAAMLRSIARDGPVATYVALAGVVLMVVLLFRRLRPVCVVLVSLAVGIIWMGGAGAALGLKLNFLNFVALPVTLGIGIDYAVNILARQTTENDENQDRALAETGSAVALCSATTIIGYGSLLIASSGALRSFGKAAALGEAGCLLAALLIIPAATRRRVSGRAAALDGAG